MKLHIDKQCFIDTNEPLDISIPLSATDDNPRAWYVNPPRFETVRTENYIGSIKEGGSVNFRDIFFNPHGHGTHTECLGHITENVYSVNDTLTKFFFKSQVLSIEPILRKNEDGEMDRIITPDQLVDAINPGVEALVIRSLPNEGDKTHKNYSSTNPPYFDVECVNVLFKAGISHLLIDLPSVDRESDGGKLIFHHKFWEVPDNPNFERTITEMIFVPNEISDGEYILNIQMAPFENDASPSRPVLYQIKKELN